MVTAARIFGDQVGSTAPVFLAFLAVHVLAGLDGRGQTVRSLRWYPGSPRHIRGRPLVLPGDHRALRHRDGPGRDALAAGLLPVRHRRGRVHRRDHRLPTPRRRRPGDTGHIMGMGTAYVAMLTAFYVDNGPHLPLEPPADRRVLAASRPSAPPSSPGR